MSEPSATFRAAFDAGAAWATGTTERVVREQAVREAWDAHGTPGPRPSAEFPAVDPARDLPKAVELLRADAPNRHPYDALLYGMAADVLEARLTKRDERTLRQMAGRMLDGDPIEDADRVELSRDLVDLADRLAGTPGDDRGRKLAELLSLADTAIGVAEQTLRDGKTASREVVAEWRATLDRLRALTSPRPEVHVRDETVTEAMKGTLSDARAVEVDSGGTVWFVFSDLQGDGSPVRLTAGALAQRLEYVSNAAREAASGGDPS